MANILDDILKNQNNILNNQAIMLNKLNAITEALGKTPTNEHLSVVTAAEGQATTTETPVTGDVSASEQKTEDTALINDAGIPWSAEFHASTQKQNNDGSWKARKGVDKEALKAYEAQFLNTGSETSDVPPAPSTPATPPAPPSANTPPNPPSTPATPPAPPKADDVKSQALSAARLLSNDYGVPYLQIVEHVLKKHGGDSMEQVKDHAAVLTDVSAWLEKVETIDSALETLSDIDEKTSGAHQLPSNAMTVLSNSAGVTKVGDVPYDKLDETVAAITDFAGQWKAWFDGQ